MLQKQKSSPARDHVALNREFATLESEGEGWGTEGGEDQGGILKRDTGKSPPTDASCLVALCGSPALLPGSSFFHVSLFICSVRAYCVPGSRDK